MKSSYILFLCLILTKSNISFAQKENLVPNPSFEEFNANDDYKAYGWHGCKLWFSPNLSTPDYYNREMENYEGWKSKRFPDYLSISKIPKARTGNAYAGLVIYNVTTTIWENASPLNKIYGEFIEIKLEKPLKEKSRYVVGLYSKINNTLFNSVYSSSFGFHFSNDSIITNVLNKLDVLPHVSNDSLNFVNDSLVWNLVSGYYTAKGGEQFLTIGNFQSEEKTPIILDQEKLSKIFKKSNVSLQTIKEGNYLIGSYWLIDDVFLYEIEDVKQTTDSLKVIKCKEQKLMSELKEKFAPLDFSKIKSGEVNNFKHLHFQSNSSQIVGEDSFTELNNLAAFLKKNRKVKIEIIGHSDNSGKEKENLKLSEARAEGITTYLISKNVLRERITYKGLGSSRPIATNTTEEGKLLNRRVEFILHY